MKNITEQMMDLERRVLTLEHQIGHTMGANRYKLDITPDTLDPLAREGEQLGGGWQHYCHVQQSCVVTYNKVCSYCGEYLDA